MTDQKELEQETTNNTEVETESTSVEVETESTSSEDSVSTEGSSEAVENTVEVTEEAPSEVSEVVDHSTEEETNSEKTQTKEESPKNTKKESNSEDKSGNNSGKWKRDRRNNRDNRPRRRQEWEKKEFEERMLEVRRVTRVTTWWRQLSFRATVLIWNKNGKIGLGVAKWNDVQSAVSKATHDAYKNIVNVTINNNGSVPYPTETKFKSAYIKLIPALPGTWLKAGASVRQVLELAWYTNILSKIVWTNNKLNNALLAITMLKRFKNFWHRFNLKKKEEIVEKADK